MASDPSPQLTLLVTSFSYKKGVPQGSTQHGGGFVFDCRCLDNPGRLPEFKDRDGRDAAVISFLENRQDVEKFYLQVYAIVSQALDNYLSRNFTDLSVSFGCTGGQHRSVYFSERLARELKGAYPITVKLVHRDNPVQTS